jgi:hypothetical protein
MRKGFEADAEGIRGGCGAEGIQWGSDVAHGPDRCGSVIATMKHQFPALPCPVRHILPIAEGPFA